MVNIENINNIESFYKKAASNFLEWSPDSKRSGLYTMHIGYQSWQKPVSNPDAVLKMSQKIIELSEIKSGQTVLDAGCGVGNLSFEINSVKPKTKVFGIDITHNHIQLANQYKKYELSPSSQFSVQDYEHIAFESGIFHRIIFCESLIHSQNKEALIQESNRVLQPNGRITIADIFMHTDVLTKAESGIMEGLKKYMHTPNLTHIKNLTTLLSKNGFSDISPRNITKHVITPEEYFSSEVLESNEEESPQDMPTLLEGLQKLMRNGKAGYYIVTAQKS